MNIDFNAVKLRTVVANFLAISSDESDLMLDLLGEIPNQQGEKFKVDITTLPSEFLKFCLKIQDKELVSIVQYRAITKIVKGSGAQDILSGKLPKTARTLHSEIELYQAEGGEFYFQIIDRYYPVILDLDYKSGYGGAQLMIGVYGKFAGNIRVRVMAHVIYNEGLKGSDIGGGRMTIQEFLKLMDIIPISAVDTFDEGSFEDAMQDSLEAPKHSIWQGTGEALIEYRSYYNTQIKIGSLDGYTLIIEPELERDTDRQSNEKVKESEMPFVRVFCLELKRYAFVDARDMEKMQWDKNLLDKLRLPGDLKKLITGLFQVKQEDLMRDIIKTKSRNMILMASGSPGIGKTLTGEVYAHIKERPLYVLEIAEIGSDLTKIEDNLKKVFQRIQAWNCILLFDEADIFFQERDSNLERSVIVGVFLRMLERFQGILFITTNRPQVIDKAFYSRITAHFKYPDLTKEFRLKIWEDKFKDAELNLKDPENMGLLAEYDLNGRDIHNKVKIFKVIHDGKEVTCEELNELLIVTL